MSGQFSIFDSSINTPLFIIIPILIIRKDVEMEFIPYKAHECFEHLYYQIPMELFFNKKYRDKLNSDSKILYGFLLNRLTLSAKNNWVDEDGNVFLIFTRKEEKLIQKRIEENIEKAEKDIAKKKDKKRIR